MAIDDLLPFVYALALGLLIGFERERSHPRGVEKISDSRVVGRRCGDWSDGRLDMNERQPGTLW